MIRFLISEMWSVCSNVLTGMMYNLSGKYFCRLTWEIFTAQHKLSHHIEPGVAFHEEGRSQQWSPSLSSQLSTRPALLVWKMLQQWGISFFDFQSILLPHFLAPEMCYTEDVVKILDQIVNDNLKANIYIQFQFPENKRLDFNQILARWELRVVEGCEICLKATVWWCLYGMVPTR